MKKIKINYKNIFIGLIFLVFFQPKIFTQIHSINIIWKVTQYFIYLFIALIYLKRGKISKIILLQGILLCVYLFSVIINGGSISQVLQIQLFCIAFIMYCELIINLYKERFIYILNSILNILIYINFICLFVFPQGFFKNGVDRVNFLAIDNGLINFIMPAVAISIISSYLKYNKMTKSCKIFICVSIMSIVKVWSATSLVGLLIMIFVIFLLIKMKKNYLLTIKNYFIVYFIVLIQVLFAHAFNFTRVFIQQVLKKDMTFTGRNVIWRDSILLLKNHLTLGVGIRKKGFLVELSGYGAYANHSHNAILEILLSGGIIGLVILFYIIYIVMRRIENCNQNMIYKTLVGYSFGFFALTITEVFVRGISFYLLIVLGYHCQYITRIYEKKWNKPV